MAHNEAQDSQQKYKIPEKYVHAVLNGLACTIHSSIILNFSLPDIRRLTLVAKRIIRREKARR